MSTTAATLLHFTDPDLAALTPLGRVKRGVAFCDDFDADWREVIDAFALDLSREDFCISAQMEERFDAEWVDYVFAYQEPLPIGVEGVSKYPVTLGMEDDRFYIQSGIFSGGDYATLTDLWVEAVNRTGNFAV